jgi:hypothetical protein
MATPITRLDDVCIFNAYKLNFDVLKSKGYELILSVMDNQATKYIKKFLTKEDCKLQLVEPHNHRVNAAKQAIQTFKDAFITALATTDRDFPLQLWDKLTTQVINTCENILHGYLYVFDLAFVILKEIYGFEFPKRFLENSSKDLTSSLLFCQS